MTRASSLPLPEAELVSLFLVSIAYGIYIVSAGQCVNVLLSSDHGSKRMRRRLMLIAIAMAVIATMDVIVNFLNVLRVFVVSRGQESVEQLFSELSSYESITGTIDIQVMSLIGDGMLVYRCYIIFSRRLSVIILPTLLWLAGGGCGVVIVYLTVTIKTGDITGSAHLAHVILTFLVITLVTNLLTTGLIVWRIRQVDREVESTHLVALTGKKRSPISKAMRIIIESGLMYTTFVLLSLITEATGSNAAYGVSQMLLVVIGISFNLIIIRVGKGTAVGSIGTYETTRVDAPADAVINFTEPQTGPHDHEQKDRIKVESE